MKKINLIYLQTKNLDFIKLINNNLNRIDIKLYNI